MDVEKALSGAIQDGIREGVRSKLGGYGGPLDKILADTLTAKDGEFRKLLTEAICSAVGDADFREEIRKAVRHKLAQTLIARFGGELEKQVNALKSDPTTRARIIIAIEEIVKEKVVV